MRLHLTEIAVRSLKPTESQTKVWDTQLRGFGVRVNGNTKSWIVMYGPRRQLKTIGRYPAVSLADARTKARRLLIEPAAETPNVSVQEAFDEYHGSHCVEFQGTRTRAETRRLYDKFIKPRFGHKKLSELNFGLLESILPLDRPSEANHVFRSTRAFLSWAHRKEYTTANPLAGKTQPTKEKQRDRILSPEEVATQWNSAADRYGTIWKLLLLTGQRRSQILSLEWEWIQEDVIEFPASIMKNGKPHIIPIGPLTLATLPAKTSKYVFPSSKGGHTKNIQEQKKEHVENLPHYVLHDLRRTMTSLHASIGTPIHVIEKLLNHTSGTFSGVVGIYQRYSFLTEMRQAVLAYENAVKSLLSTSG